MKPLRPFNAVLLIVLSGSVLCAQDYPQDMPLSRILIDGEGWQLVSEGHQFTEGPAVDAQGNVYFSDVPKSLIHRIDASTGKVTFFIENSGRTNGLMFGPDGLLYGCRMADKQIVAYKPDGSHEVIADGVTGNDIVVNAKGDLWFTEPKENRLSHIGPDRRMRVVAGDLRPNGLILTPDQGTLIVTDSQEPVLWAFRVEPDGHLTHRDRYFLPLRLDPRHEGPGSDGMTFDQAGRIYVATRAGLQMFDPTGRLGGVIAKPQDKFLSNVVFGGPHFSWLYATCSDKVYRRKTQSPGAPYFLKK